MGAHADQYRSHVLLPLQQLLRAVVSRVGGMVPGSAEGPHEAVVLRVRRDARFVGSGQPFHLRTGLQIRHRASLPGAPAPAVTLHLEPGVSRISVGLVRAAPGSMRSIRAAMVARPALWLTVAARLESTGAVWADAPTRRLTVREQQHGPLVPYLAHSNQAVCWWLTDRAVSETDLLPELVQAVRHGLPLLRYQCLAMGLSPRAGGIARQLYHAEQSVFESAAPG